jgi:hypothetical protein
LLLLLPLPLAGASVMLPGFDLLRLVLLPDDDDAAGLLLLLLLLVVPISLFDFDFFVFEPLDLVLSFFFFFLRSSRASSLSAADLPAYTTIVSVGSDVTTFGLRTFCCSLLRLAIEGSERFSVCSRAARVHHG